MQPEQPLVQAAAVADRPETETAADRVHPSYVLLTVLTVVSAALDLASKAWAKATLTGFDAQAGRPKRFVVIEGYFDFIYAENPGGAWSMLRSLPEIVRRPFFLVVSSVAIVFIISIYVRIDARQRALAWGLPLALGGALGNLVDRVRYGYVIDFIHVWFKHGAGNEFHWPTFNVADVAIVVGVGLMAGDLFFGRRAGLSPGEPSSHEPSVADPQAPTGEAAGAPPGRFDPSPPTS